MPGVTVADVASVVVQLSVEQEPAVTLVGLAMKLFIIGGVRTGADAATVTVAVRVMLPLALVAVMV